MLMIDFRPLETSVTAQQLTSFNTLPTKQNYYLDYLPEWSRLFRVIIWAIGGFVAGLLPGIFIGIAMENYALIWLTGLVFAAVACLAINLVAKWQEQRAAQAGAQIYAFLQANPGLRFRPATSQESTGLIFQKTNTRHFVIESADGSYRIGNIKYYVYSRNNLGSGTNREVYNWGYAAIKLNRKLPHMVLDSKQNNDSLLKRTLSDGTQSLLPSDFNRNQTLSLEGNFDQYFTLFAPKEYERDALYIFTPDFMSLLIDQVSQFDIEIIDDQLFIYIPKGLHMNDPAMMRRLFSVIAALQSKTLTRTDSYRDDRSDIADTVASSGRRLASSPLWPSMGLVAALIAWIVVASLG